MSAPGTAATSAPSGSTAWSWSGSRVPSRACGGHRDRRSRPRDPGRVMAARFPGSPTRPRGRGDPDRNASARSPRGSPWNDSAGCKRLPDGSSCRWRSRPRGSPRWTRAWHRHEGGDGVIPDHAILLPSGRHEQVVPKAGGGMDTELVQRARRGDRDAFATLATDLYARFHRVAYSVLRDRELALDAVQTAMLAAWRELPSLRDPGPVRGVGVPVADPCLLRGGPEAPTPAASPNSAARGGRADGIR